MMMMHGDDDEDEVDDDNDDAALTRSFFKVLQLFARFIVQNSRYIS